MSPESTSFCLRRNTRSETTHSTQGSSELHIDDRCRLPDLNTTILMQRGKWPAVNASIRSFAGRISAPAVALVADGRMNARYQTGQLKQAAMQGSSYPRALWRRVKGRTMTGMRTTCRSC